MSDPSIAQLKAQRSEFAKQADDLQREQQAIFEALGVTNLDDALDNIELLQEYAGYAIAEGYEIEAY
jgi:hypothetical protein